MDPIQAIILGFIQGLTEWLPISSTGHLRLAEHFFGLTLPLLFDVSLHVGTLIIIVIFFRKNIKLILVAIMKRDFRSENGKLIPLIIVGTFPTALIGIALINSVESYFDNYFSIAIAFLACGVLLYFSKIARKRKENISYIDALVIGTVQGIALLPGLSRSGLTITVAMILGLRSEKAFNFSFLLSIPALIGALGFMLYEQLGMLNLAGLGFLEVFLGIAISLVVSYSALVLLRKVVYGEKFYFFSFYCWFIGAFLLAFSLSSI